MEKKDMKSIGTKVSPEAYARLKSICEEKDITIYDLLQMFCDVAIRYMDSNHNLNYELCRIIRLFDGMQHWGNHINVCEHFDKDDIVEAFYVFRNPKQKGERIVHVTPLMGEQQATFNIQEITERFFEIINNSLYRQLRLVGVDLNTNSVLETIDTLADLHRENPDERELREQFESNDWQDNARRHDSDVHYRRKVSHSVYDDE